MVNHLKISKVNIQPISIVTIAEQGYKNEKLNSKRLNSSWEAHLGFSLSLDGFPIIFMFQRCFLLLRAILLFSPLT